MEIKNDCLKEYTKRKIEQIEFIQKSLNDLRKCEYFQECLSQAEFPKLLARTNALLTLGTAINLLQGLIAFYEKVL